MRTPSMWKWISPLLILMLVRDGFSPGKSVARAAEHDLHSAFEQNRQYVRGEESTLRFKTCNGFANQRISIAYGIVIAKALNRSAVVPDLLAFGEQMSDELQMSGSSNGLAFEDVYNMQLFEEQMEVLDVPVLSTAKASTFSYTEVDIKGLPNPALDLQQHSSMQHMQISCPIWSVPPQVMHADAATIKATLRAMQPSQQISSHVKTVTQHLKRLSEDGSFNFLHLRLENDWTAHCQRWTSIDDGLTRNNCLNNTFDIVNQLRNKEFKPEVPLYVSLFWDSAEGQPVGEVLSSLIEAGYNVVADPEKLKFLHSLPREQAAAVNFFVAMQSTQFIGNSVSSFSALQILERRLQGLWASYYNGGDIPLAMQLPLFTLPWIFTYNSWSLKYEYMLKAAVASAKAHGTLQAVCLYSGDTAAPIYRWMKQQGVQIVVRDPPWASTLESGLKKGKNIQHSHLYADGKMALGTWQRIDVPLLPQLNEHEYVLFTDSDVYFRKPVNLQDFQLPLPATVGMAPEMHDEFPYNAGIMLMNLPALRATYRDFVKFIFSNDAGMFFSQYGPGDQGAYNQFYEESARPYKLAERFNAKPYKPFNEDAAIVHWHGPKPAQFMSFLKTGECRFKQGAHMCKMGLNNSYCQYLQEWSSYLPPRLVTEASKILVKCAAHMNSTE